MIKLLSIALFIYGGYNVISGLLGLYRCNRDLRAINTIEKRLK